MMDEIGLNCGFWSLPLGLLLVVWLINKVGNLTSRLTALEERTQAIEEWLPTLWAAVAKESASEGMMPDEAEDETPEAERAPPETPAPDRDTGPEVVPEDLVPSTGDEVGVGEPLTDLAETDEWAHPEPTTGLEGSPVDLEPSYPQDSASPESWGEWSDLEESLGARLPVWLGAIALALAGAFLVKYSVEQGWLSPLVRVALGISFGLGLEAAAMLLRRSADRIAAGLAAAGIAVLYASFLAAVHLYSLLPAVAGFALMAVTTVAAVALSLIHGPIVAIVGMIGGFLTPYWVSEGEPDAPRLFTYLLLLHAGVVVVSRKRSWPLLPLASLTISFLWVAGFLSTGFQLGDGPWLIGFMLLALVLWLALDHDWVSGAPAESEEDGSASFPRKVAILGAAVAALVLAGSATWADGFDGSTWGLMILLAAGLVFLGRWRPQLEALAWLAAFGVIALSEVWKVAPGPDPATALVLGGLASLGLILVGGGLAAVRGARAPEHWATFAALSGLFLFRDLITWKSSVLPFGDMTHGLIAVAVAGIFTAAAAWLGEWPGAHSGAEQLPSTTEKTLTADLSIQVGWVLGLTATLFASWGIYFLGGDMGRTTAWALLALFLVWLAGRPRVRDLVWLAAVPASLAFVDLLAAEVPLSPGRLSDSVLEAGVRIVPFLVAIVLSIALAERGSARGLPGARRMALIFRIYNLVALTILILRSTQLLTAPQTSNPFVLDGAENLALMALALALLLAQSRWPAALGRVEQVGAGLLTGFALAQATVQLIVDNPVVTGSPVGTLPVFNHLLWVYGGVAVFSVLVARSLPKGDGSFLDELSWLPSALYLTSLVYAFFLVSFEILHVFRGSDLSSAPAAPLAERWALSAGWLILGMVLLVAGIGARARLLRGAALAVTGLAVVKVFLFDIGRLGDLYRVVSFLGLGLSLLLLAWLYQRFVFRSSRTSEPSE